MDKKDIYEHLAKIYLEASSQKKKKTIVYPKYLKKLLFLSLVLVFASAAALIVNFKKGKFTNSLTELVLLSDAAKINFHFDPAKKEIYTINLNKLNLARFRALGFSARKVGTQNTVALRVEFATPYKEQSEIYFRDIPTKWKDYKIDLAEFKGLTDWSEMQSLLFAIEEWNTKDKKGVVYIDNVRFLR